MTCSNCCNLDGTCGYGVGVDPPANTRNIGVMLLNDVALDTNSTTFSVNGWHKDTNGNHTGDTQVILEGTDFILIGKESSGFYQKTVPGISFVNGRCYFMGLTIQTSPTREIIAFVKDSEGNSGTTSVSTNGDFFYIANVKHEDGINTYFFHRPTWWWESISGCGVSASFWNNGHVFEGQSSNCSITSTGKKIEMVLDTKIKLGRNAASYQSCGTTLW